MAQPSPGKTPTGVVIPRTPAAANAPDPDLRSEINAQLIKDGHIDRIHNHLSHILSSDASNWPTRIRQHALTLLRSPDSECDTFPRLMEQVMADIREDTNAARREAGARKRAEERGEVYAGTGGGIGGGRGRGVGWRFRGW
ncbi:hypothetical protein GMDG_01689 [Pseudogymnoascus destructans 20631-21]|uniref:Uncharacterized protein n=1 Tax=Pseudogymnoascus destructans (strain ATCC MYA-4855 / 20631-21) TaxID=658429 RepID=L8FZU7_PSED2|nr:hypothetical protein GMDG_01689 [Pseudogymnoascus destructans 20631-21]